MAFHSGYGGTSSSWAHAAVIPTALPATRASAARGNARLRSGESLQETVLNARRLTPCIILMIMWYKYKAYGLFAVD